MRASLLIALLLLPAGAHAQATAPTTLTLQEAIQRAQQQGPAAQVARSARDAARYRDNAFNARLLPQLVLSGEAANLNRAINPIDLPDGSTQFVSQANNRSSLGLGFSQEIPLTGGRVTVGSEVSRIDEFGEPELAASIRRRRSSCGSSSRLFRPA